jgi:uncharacterized protein (DUF1501 family)
MTPLDTRSRRQFLMQNAQGVGGVALAWLLGQEKLLAAPHMPRDDRKFDMTPKPSQAPARARAMISLFMHGGPSHVDLLDPKPELTKHSGRDYQGEVIYSFANRASKKLFGSPWKFAKHGQCGTEVSELLPHLASVVDEVAVIRSMHTDINGHESSIWYMNTGKSQPGRPALGSWLTYGLGSESQDLPAYVVLSDPDGHPVDGVRNWSNGWLPPLFQGTVIRPREPRILNLDPPAHLRGQYQQQNLSLLAELNRQHLERHAGEADLEARIASYELAARMQTAAKEALDLSGESEATKKLYGLDDTATAEYGTRCLIARRLVERGVRFVQLFLGGQPWDTHTNIRGGLPSICRRTDQPSAALIKDLKSRGLLDTTLVHWGGEMGRLPVIQNEKNIGRDHNTHGFSMWLAGGGIKAGCIHGETDELGHKAVKDVVTHRDYHGTLLHLFGLSPEQVSFPRPVGSGSLLDGQSPNPVSELLARA